MPPRLAASLDAHDDSVMLDYETLRVIWWLLLGIVLIGFAVMDGFDLGAAALRARARHATTPSAAR